MPRGVCPREFIPIGLGPKTVLQTGHAKSWVPDMEENDIGLNVIFITLHLFSVIVMTHSILTIVLFMFKTILERK